MQSALWTRSHRGVGARLLIALALVVCAALSNAAAALATDFNPALVISDANMRANDTLSQRGIQDFLNTQKGPLKALVTADYQGKKKPAAQIIAEACNAWHINPRVMLTLLQKEQSLLTRTALAKNTLDRAIGAGCPGGSTNKYPGFGKQMWYGARLIDGYGEGKNGSTVALWKAPSTVVFDGYQSPKLPVKTANLATYKLYVYNPSIGAKAPYGDLSKQSGSVSGNANFWIIYRKYFGDPFAAPYPYHSRATMIKNAQLWNSSIGSKRSPSPKKNGNVNVIGPILVRRGRQYVRVSWGGNPVGGWVGLDSIKWR
jgi:hypothetical protein